jgi:hypothetical protein
MALQSIFAKEHYKNYPYRFAFEAVVHEMHGGKPLNRDAAIEHVKRKLADNEDLLRKVVAEMIADQVEAGDEVDTEKAIEFAAKKGLNGFYRNRDGELVYRGFQLKAAIKEAASVAVNAGDIPTSGWGIPDNGNYKKQIKAWLPEHVFVLEDEIPLGRIDSDGIERGEVLDVGNITDHDGISQRPMHGGRGGSAITMEEYVLDAKIAATIVSDYNFKPEHWSAIWTRAEMLGVGASRSQGFGKFVMTKWEPIEAAPRRKR